MSANKNAPEANQSAQDRVKEITDKLEAGLKALFEGDNFKQYLDTMSKFHNYSFNNTMLIALQKPEATLVAGFNSWKNNFERSVNKGEKGIKIFAPAPYKKKKMQEKLDPDTDLPVLDKDGKPVMEEVTITIPAFKVVSVFDVSQTNGKELPTLGVDELKGDVENFEKFFGVLKEVSPVPIKFAEIDGSAKGFYHQVDKDITIKQDMPEIQTIKTAIHEIAHAKLHDHDMKKADVDSPKKDRNTEEVEAESIAYTVCQHFGIDTSDYSFAYVASWGSGKDTPELKASLETIRSTASELITHIEDKLRGLEKEKVAEQETEVANSPAQSAPVKNSNIIGNTPYKDIENKAYLKVQTSSLPVIEKYLEGEKISYSGRKTGKFTTITVAGEDYLSLCNFVNDFGMKDQTFAPKQEQDKNIIGNTEYKDIPDKHFIRMSADKAREIAAILEKGNLPFSGRIDGDKATITISKTDKETYKQVIMSPEEKVKAYRKEVEKAMTELDNAEKTAEIANNNLSTVEQEIMEVMDDNGQFFDTIDPEHQSELLDKYRSAATIANDMKDYLEEKQANFEVAATEFNGIVSQQKNEQAYDGKFPDENVSVLQMEEYGYKFVEENKMLPLETEKAALLFELGAEVYRLYEDNTEGLLENKAELTEHSGYFGIEAAEWERVQPLAERVEALNAAQALREHFLLKGKPTAAVGIYQLNEGESTRGLTYMNSKYLEEKGIVPDRKNYTLVYSFEANPEDLSNKNAFLNKVFEQFNIGQPENYKGRSLSVSDVIVIRNGEDLTAHYVDSFGFKELENFGAVHKEIAQQAEKAEAEQEKPIQTAEKVTKPKRKSKAKAEKKPSVLETIEEIKKNSPKQPSEKVNEKGVEL